MSPDGTSTPPASRVQLLKLTCAASSNHGSSSNNGGGRNSKGRWLVCRFCAVPPVQDGEGDKSGVLCDRRWSCENVSTAKYWDYVACIRLRVFLRGRQPEVGKKLHSVAPAPPFLFPIQSRPPPP